MGCPGFGGAAGGSPPCADGSRGAAPAQGERGALECKQPQGRQGGPRVGSPRALGAV